MAAAVSGFLGFAISKVVDQFWTPTADHEDDQQHIVDAIEEPVMEAEPVEIAPVTKPSAPRKAAPTRRTTRRKMQAPKSVAVAVPLDVKTRSYSDADPTELSSNASTCGSSDDEDEPEVEDIGAKEMRLMLERAQQIKRLTKQTRQQQRTKESRKASVAAKPKDEPAAVVAIAAPASRFPDVCEPIRLQNTTHNLWNWSVYSGFAVDTKIAHRGPRNMRHLYCAAGEGETLESEELLRDAAASVVADL